MKKYWVLISVLGIFIVFMTLNNNELKNELNANSEELQALEESEETINYEASEVVRDFVLSYFNYRGNPVEEGVKDLVSSDVLKELNFGVDEYSDELEKVGSRVNDINVYYGESTEEKQKVLVLFDNVIELNDVESVAKTIMEFDVERNEGNWEISEFTFNQY